MRKLFFCVFLVFFPFLVKAMEEKICLNMIVKNESKVIKRCLDSVKPIIDYWVIVDTGSTDGTQKIIKDYLKDIPGELYERPWKNFGENRTEAFELAKKKGDYILFMDADDTLEFEPNFKFPPLKKELYNMWRGSKSFSYIKPQLVKASLPWKWVGVTHEYLGCDQFFSSEILEGVRYISEGGGGSWADPNKFLKNVELLSEGLKKEPNNSRYVFYLAESYRDAGLKAQALEWYQKRIKMGEWEEEIFWSMLQIAHLLRDIGLAPSIVIESYELAHKFRPHRAEPIYYLVEICMQQGNYSKAYEYLKRREFISKPAQKDYLFNVDWIEQYGLLFQMSICSYYVGQYEESLKACNELLEIKELPEAWHKQTILNRTFPIDKLIPKQPEKSAQKNPKIDRT